MPQLLSNLLQALRERRGVDMNFLCRRLMSERGEASQTAVAQEIITSYKKLNAEQRRGFFEMLYHSYSPDPAVVLRAAASYQESPNADTLVALSNVVEPPRQELFRRINTAPGGTEALVYLREHLLELAANSSAFKAIDADLRHLFRSWFNRGFLRLERISWQTSALMLEKLICYESVHEINGWPDLHRRLERDRRCFAFFHPSLANEPIIFVEVALVRNILGDLEPLLDVNTPVLEPERANTAIFYSINNCLPGLRNIPFGNFLIKQVVAELAAEFPNVSTYCTLSPLPRLSRTLRDASNEHGFTPERLARLLAEDADALTNVTGGRDPVASFFQLLENPLAHREVLEAPLRRVALAHIAKARQHGKLCDPVATFHLSNGARLERINTFGNLRQYGLEASFGVTANYRYVPDELEENHERFVREGQIRVSSGLFSEQRKVSDAWDGSIVATSGRQRKNSAPVKAI